MRKKYMWWIIGIIGVTLLAAALWGPIVSNVEQPKYQVVKSSGNIEIRDYAPMIVAEVDIPGERRDAMALSTACRRAAPSIARQVCPRPSRAGNRLLFQGGACVEHVRRTRRSRHQECRHLFRIMERMVTRSVVAYRGRFAVLAAEDSGLT